MYRILILEINWKSVHHYEWICQIWLSLQIFEKLFTFACKSGYLTFNPTLALQSIRVPERISSKVLSEEQVQRMILYSKNKRNELIIKLFYYTGIRIDELAKLTTKSFQKNESGCILIVEGKRKKVRSIHIPAGWRILWLDRRTIWWGLFD